MTLLYIYKNLYKYLVYDGKLKEKKNLIKPICINFLLSFTRQVFEWNIFLEEKPICGYEIKQK